jgi:hypothetical protein
MGADEVKAWSDALGPTLIAVIALVVVVFPMIRRNREEKPETPAALQVTLALMRRDLDDHEDRLKVLETKRTRA